MAAASGGITFKSVYLAATNSCFTNISGGQVAATKDFFFFFLILFQKSDRNPPLYISPDNPQFIQIKK